MVASTIDRIFYKRSLLYATTKILLQCCSVRHQSDFDPFCSASAMQFISALEVCYENALYKFTFDIDI